MTMNTDFTIEYSGESEVDLNSLLTSLLNFGAAIQEIQSKVAPEAKVDVKVKPFGEGSFLVFLSLHASDFIASLSPLFNKDNLSLVENILSVFANTLTLKEFLNGSKPKDVVRNEDGQTLTIENNHGQVFQIQTDTFNLYLQNPKIDALYAKAFSAIEKEPNITGLKVKTKQKELSKISGSSFQIMSKPIDDYEGEHKELEKVGVFLQATKLSFEEGYVWGFVYEGNKITAKITDINFYKRIENNERFAKGDTLKVDLKIYQTYDKNLNAYLNKSYEIIKVWEHIEAPQQYKMF